MCLTAPARLVSARGPEGVIELDGRRRRTSLLLVPDAVPGDWVLVGAGHVLRRLDPEEAADLAALLSSAIPAPTGGHP